MKVEWWSVSSESFFAKKKHLGCCWSGDIITRKYFQTFASTGEGTGINLQLNKLTQHHVRSSNIKQCNTDEATVKQLVCKQQGNIQNSGGWSATGESQLAT